MNFGDFWLQSNSNGKGKKFSLKDLHNLKPEDIAKNPKLQKLITLFDSDSSGNLETNELESIFADLKTAAKDDILSDNELGLYLSNKFKDQDIKVEDVKELLNAASDKQIQELNYTDLDGNSISDKFENGEIVERTITSQDENGNKVEVNVFYENKKPVKQLQIVNNEIVATISYDYSSDNENPTTTTIFKNKDGIVEEVNTPQKRTLTLYKTESIDDFDKTKNHRLQQVVVTDKAQYVAEYDGKGNTLIIVQNSETPELIAQKFGIKLSDLGVNNRGVNKNTTLQAGQKLIIKGEYDADSKVMKPRKSEGEVKQKAAQHAFEKVYDKIFASAIDEYTIKAENAGKDVYEYAEKYLISKGAKKTDANFNARKNDLANELIALNGRDAKYTAGNKIKYIKKTLDQATVNKLKDTGMIPNQENQLFFARFNYLTPQQQTNVIEVLKQCKAKGITDPQKINAEILRYYPEIQMFETDKKVLQKPTKAMARSYMAHYLLEQIDAIIAVYNQTATADQSLWTLGTGLIVELQDLLHISTKFINDNLGTCIAEGDSRVNLAPMLNKLRQECLNLAVLADMEEKNKDESFDKKKNIPEWEGSQFDKTFNALFYGKSMNYDAVITYLQAVQEFQKAPEKDRNNKNSQAYKKIKAATNKLNSQLPAFQDIAKRIEGWSSGTQIVGGLTDLGVQVAMLYMSGGSSAIARSSMYVGNATRYSVGTAMGRMATSKFGSTAVGRLLVKDGTQFITKEGSAILASMVTSSAETAAFFQGTKVLGALEDGKVTGEEVAVINEGFEGLFKFGMVGSAIAGPLGVKASELTSKLLNSEKAIASTMKMAIEGKGTTLDKVLKALCENSNAVSKITEFGTSFSINAGYMAVADNTGYGEAMGNLAQMDAVSKLVVAMLGGKNTAFLTPQKVQQIKTSLAGYEVKLSVYKGQKIYEVTDKSGTKTRLANEQELFMFIIDREVTELTKPETNIPEISTERSELRDKARTENPAVVAEAKVKEEWQQHDIDTGVNEDSKPVRQTRNKAELFSKAN